MLWSGFPQGPTSTRATLPTTHESSPSPVDAALSEPNGRALAERGPNRSAGLGSGGRPWPTKVTDLERRSWDLIPRLSVYLSGAFAKATTEETPGLTLVITTHNKAWPSAHSEPGRRSAKPRRRISSF